MFTRALDVFNSISDLVSHVTEFFSNNYDIWNSLYWISRNIGTYCYFAHHILIVIVLIHWKTVLVKKRRLDICLYVTSLTFAIIHIAAEDILIKYFARLSIFQQIADVLDYAYFIVFSTISIYCYVVIRRVDTSAYSSATLIIYHRMTLVHFTQTALLISEFLILFPFQVIMKRILIAKFGTEDGSPFLDFIFYFGSFDYSYVVLGSFIRGSFFYWALRGALKAAASGAATPTLATGVLRIFARRTIEQAAGTVPPEPQDPLQDP